MSPVVSEGSALDALRRELAAAAVAGEVAVLHGSYTGDLFPLSDREAVRLPKLVAMVLAEEGRTPILHSPGAGVRQLPPPGSDPVPAELPGPEVLAHQAIVDLVRGSLTAPRPWGYILDWISLTVPAVHTGVTVSPEAAAVIEVIQWAATDPAFHAGGHAVVLIERPGELHPALRTGQGFRLIRVPAPDAALRRAGFKLLLARNEADPDRFAPLAPDLDWEQAVGSSGGLAIDDLLRESRRAAHEGVPLDRARLEARRAAAVDRQAPDVLAVGSALPLTEAVGAPHVRRYIHERQLSGKWPAVIILVGPYGSGKSQWARVFAGTLGWLFIEWRHPFSMWVGESERRTTQGYETIWDLRPAVVFHDEAEEELPRRGGWSGDSGTSDRFRGRFRSETGGVTENRMDVLATNWVELLDRAVLDRADIIPVLHATLSEVVELLPALARQLGCDLADDVDASAIAALPGLRLTTPRALLHVLRRAGTLAAVEAKASGAPISHRHVLGAVEDYHPDADALQEEYIGLKAVQYCRSRSLLPWVAAREEGRDEVLPYIRPLLDEHGEIDRRRLLARVVDLESDPTIRALRQGW